MKKNKLRNYLKLGILFFVISIFSFSCQKDTLNEEETLSRKPPDLTITKQRGGQLIASNPTLREKLSKFRKGHNSEFASRTITSNIYSFSIDTTYIQTIETDAYISYTFNVERNETITDTLENYVLTSFNDGTYKQYLIKYPILITESEPQYDINNAVVEIINDDTLLYREQGTTCVITTQQYEDPVCVNVNCGGATGNGKHSVGDQCNAVGDDRATIKCTTGGWVNVGLGCSSGGNTDFSGNPPDTTVDGSGNPDPTNPDEVILPLPFEEDDCKKLKEDISDVPLIKTRLKELRDSQSNFEEAFKVNKLSNGLYAPGTIVQNSSNGSNEVNIRPNSQTTVIAHKHTNSVFYKMFSAPDILKMGEMANKVQNSSNSSVVLTEITFIVVFKNGINDFKTFALRFDNARAAQNLQDILNNRSDKRKFKKKLESDYNSDNTGSPLYQSTTTLAKQQQHLFNLLDDKNLNISLYEANFDSNGFVDSWQKINKDTLAKEPCN